MEQITMEQNPFSQKRKKTTHETSAGTLDGTRARKSRWNRACVIAFSRLRIGGGAPFWPLPAAVWPVRRPCLRNLLPTCSLALKNFRYYVDGLHLTPSGVEGLVQVPHHHDVWEGPGVRRRLVFGALILTFQKRIMQVSKNKWSQHVSNKLKGTDLVLSDSCLFGFSGHGVQASVSEHAGGPVPGSRVICLGCAPWNVLNITLYVWQMAWVKRFFLKGERRWSGESRADTRPRQSACAARGWGLVHPREPQKELLACACHGVARRAGNDLTGWGKATPDWLEGYGTPLRFFMSWGERI